jgi:superfamily II DNA or RNA helicase
MATGSGKTLVVARLISELKVAPFIFIVLTKDLMQQAYDVMSTCLNEEIGKIGDGVCDIKNINVMTVQTAVMALNGKNIKINDYQFDDEDEWDEKGIESVEKAESIKQLLKDAKGIYFDETHHASAKTARDVITGATSAYYRYGGSATTKREDNADILIQAMFGSKIVSINASYLIKKGYLVKPYIFFDPINSKIDFHSYQKVYKHCVVENQDFHLHVAKTAEHLVSKGLTVLVLVKQYAHGDYLKSMIKYSEFITGKMSLKQRTEEIDKLRKGERRVMISTSLSDEGLDLPDLSAVLLCGLGKSVSRTMQRIGRVLRTHKNKSKAIVVVYDHNARFLKKHSDKIRKILKKESEFILMNSNGGDYILDEIDKVLGIKVENTLF